MGKPVPPPPIHPKKENKYGLSFWMMLGKRFYLVLFIHPLALLVFPMASYLYYSVLLLVASSRKYMDYETGR